MHADRQAQRLAPSAHRTWRCSVRSTSSFFAASSSFTVHTALSPPCSSWLANSQGACTSCWNQRGLNRVRLPTGGDGAAAAAAAPGESYAALTLNCDPHPTRSPETP